MATTNLPWADLVGAEPDSGFYMVPGGLAERFASKLISPMGASGYTPCVDPSKVQISQSEFLIGTLDSLPGWSST